MKALISDVVMSMNSIPKLLYKNNVAGVLDEIRDHCGKLVRGRIYGIIAIDQDAKIIAVDADFDRDINYWDLSSIGAALYGVARQGQDFFEADELIWASIIYNNMQLFVRSIGQVTLRRKGLREILIVLLCEKKINIGIIILQMNQFRIKIKTEIERNESIKKTLKMNEEELKTHIRDLKKQLFNSEQATSE